MSEPNRRIFADTEEYTLLLRSATRADIPTLERWDTDPTVIASTTDDPDIAVAFGEENDWEENLALHQDDVWEYWIAEIDSRPIGAMQLIDPLNSNTRAHKFYQRIGFRPTHRQMFNNGEDDCLVHRLTRADWLARFQGD